MQQMMRITVRRTRSTVNTTRDTVRMPWLVKNKGPLTIRPGGMMTFTNQTRSPRMFL